MKSAREAGEVVAGLRRDAVSAVRRGWRPPPVHRPSPLTTLAWWWLRRRGWAWRANEPEFCTSLHRDADGDLLDRGWSPLFSIRYGKTPCWVTDRRLHPPVDPEREANAKRNRDAMVDAYIEGAKTEASAFIGAGSTNGENE